MASETLSVRVSDKLALVCPFDGLSSDTLKALAVSVNIRFVKKEETVLEQGAPPPDKLYIVAEGSIRLFYHDGEKAVILDDRNEGEIFSPSPDVPLSTPSPYSAVASDDSLLFEIPWTKTKSTFRAPYASMCLKLYSSLASPENILVKRIYDGQFFKTIDLTLKEYLNPHNAKENLRMDEETRLKLLTKREALRQAVARSTRSVANFGAHSFVYPADWPYTPNQANTLPVRIIFSQPRDEKKRLMTLRHFEEFTEEIKIHVKTEGIHMTSPLGWCDDGKHQRRIKLKQPLGFLSGNIGLWQNVNSSWSVDENSIPNRLLFPFISSQDHWLSEEGKKLTKTNFRNGILSPVFASIRSKAKKEGLTSTSDIFELIDLLSRSDHKDAVKIMELKHALRTLWRFQNENEASEALALPETPLEKKLVSTALRCLKINCFRIQDA
ncbi:hypothetical protein FUAX_32340 [Fulvitalea axinellae]|uniref:Cyclic nucleotide-binding domain-containing protein n=1 Tax=Fulvitalea axinellae TaxID=1182444 RepID=A0AAU9CUW1_9BACT|nr:hypothetical protein FUAX_32340 [Fulvitalea axinellae]